MSTKTLAEKTLAVFMAFCMVFTMFSGVASARNDYEAEIELDHDYPYFVNSDGDKKLPEGYKMIAEIQYEKDETVYAAVYDVTAQDFVCSDVTEIDKLDADKIKWKFTISDFEGIDEDSLVNEDICIDREYSIVLFDEDNNPDMDHAISDPEENTFEFVPAGEIYSISLDEEEIIANIEDYRRTRSITADIDEELVDKIYRQHYSLVKVNLDSEGDVSVNEDLGFGNPVDVTEAIFADDGELTVVYRNDEVRFFFGDEDLQPANKYVVAFEFEDGEDYYALPDLDDEDDILYEDSYFIYRYELEDLDYDNPKLDESFLVRGKLVDANDKKVETDHSDRDRSKSSLKHGNLVLLEGDDGNEVDDNRSRRDGSFHLSCYVQTTEDYHIGVARGDGYFVYKTIKGDARELDVYVTPDNFIHSIHRIDADEVDVVVEFEVEYDRDNVIEDESDIFKSTPIKDKDFRFYYECDDDEEHDLKISVNDDIFKWDLTDPGIEEFLEEDDTLTIVVEITDEVNRHDRIYKGDVKVDVEDPDDVNVVGLAGEVEVEDYYKDGELKDWVVVGDYDEDDGYKGFESIEIFMQGAGVDIEWDEDEWEKNGNGWELKDDDGDVIGEYVKKTGEVKILGEFKPEQAGQIEVEIIAYDDDEFDDEVDTVQLVIEVDGYYVEFSESEFLVDKNHDFTITLTDHLGRAMNNATVTIVGEESGESEKVGVGADDDIFKGEYHFEDFEPEEVEDYRVEVDRRGEMKAYFEEGICVVGELVYQIEVEKEGLVYGVDQEFSFTVLKDGEAVEVDFIEIDVDDETVLTLDEDEGEKPGIEFSDDMYTVTLEDDAVPTDTDYDLKVYVGEDDDEKKIGRTTIEVAIPEMNIDRVKTDRFEYEYVLELTHPFTGEEFDVDEVTFEPEQEDIYVRDLDRDYFEEGGEPVSFDDGEVYLAVAIDEDEFDYKEDNPIVNMHVKIDEEFKIAEIEILRPQMNFNPGEVVRGVESYLEVEYLDAAGNPIAGYDVTFVQDDVSIETDEYGIVEFDIDAGTTILYFEFEADVDEIDYDDDNIELDPFKKSIRAARDSDGPDINYPETVEEDTAVIEIEDLTGVDRTFIDGAMVFPPESPIVNLVPGENTFNIYTVDRVGNATAERIVIVYEVPNMKASTTIGADHMIIDGQKFDFEEGEAPFIENDRTYLPVRALMEAFGACVTWESEDRSVTIETEEATVVFYLDETTYTVNGEEKNMDVVPFLDEDTDRTYLPFRYFLEDALGAEVTWDLDTRQIDIVF